MLRTDDTWTKLWLEALGYQINVYNAEILNYVVEHKPRFICIYGGERSGKSFNTVASLFNFVPIPDDPHEKQRVYWIVGPDFNQCRAEFSYLFNLYKGLGLVTRYSMPEATTVRWYMELVTNERWETRSSSDVTKLASFSIHGAMVVEANQHSPLVWPKIRGRLAENRGWCILSGTYENCSEWFVDLWNKWKVPNRDGGVSFSLPTWANTVAFPGGYNDPEIQSLRSSFSETWFNERYAGIPAKPSNLVIPELDYEKHVGLVEPIDGEPVELFIDPGKKVYAVGFVQKVGRTARVLDCVYKRGWIAQKVIPEVMRHPLFQRVRENSGYHGAIDIAGFSEPGTVSQAELWYTLAGVNLYGAYYREVDSINAIRAALADDAIRFNNMGNESINGQATEPLAEFRLWRWPDDGGVRSDNASPIDQNNHFIKALAYWWLYRFGVDRRSDNKKPRKQRAGKGWKHGSGTDQADDRRLRAGETAIQIARRRVVSRLGTQVLVSRRIGRSKADPRARTGDNQHTSRSGRSDK